VSRLTAQISRSELVEGLAEFALLGNEASISICYSIVPHKLFPSKVQYGIVGYPQLHPQIKLKAYSGKSAQNALH